MSSNPLDRATARSLAAALLFYGQDRGDQSAGCFTNDAIFKKAQAPADFILSSRFFNLFTKPTKLVLCHTRQPTCGGLGSAQAQPFRSGNVVTVHNGMLWGAPATAKKWNIRKPSGVDSELVTTFVAEYGAHMLPDFISDSDGPSSIACAVGEELYLVRSGNPLSYIHLSLAGTKLLAFASTTAILMNALRHVWLLDGTNIPRETKERCLIHASPHQLTTIGKKFKHPGAFSWSGYSRYDYDFDETWFEKEKERNKHDRNRIEFEAGGRLWRKDSAGNWTDITEDAHNHGG